MDKGITAYNLKNFKLMESNLLELINKFSNSVHSNDDKSTVTWTNSNGEKMNFDIPNIGSVRKELNNVKRGMNKLSGNSNVIELEYDDGKVKKFKASNEFETLSRFDDVSNKQLSISNYFRTKNNWFFESFLNPLLYVNIDISTDYASVDTTKFSVKRVILMNLSQNQIEYWKSEIEVVKDWDFDTLINILKNNSIEYVIDDNIVDLPPAINRKYGSFSVIDINTNTINISGIDIDQNYYRLDSLEYMEMVEGTYLTKKLSVGDVLITKNDSEYEIKAIDNDNKLVLLERISGIDVVSIGIDVLKIQPGKYKVPYLQVNIGYNEREVIFIRPIDVVNNITTNQWSKGYPLYTNELFITLNDGNKISLDEFYQKYVSDFGMLIMNLAKDKVVPTVVGVKPDAPLLDSKNFKVVRINDHLKKTQEVDNIKRKFSVKEKLKSEITSLDKSIVNNRSKMQNPLIPDNEKMKASSEIETLVNEKNIKLNQYESVVKELDIGFRDNPEITVSNKYRIRGFWEVPNYKETIYGKQHIIGFIVSYRYLNKNKVGKNPDEIKYMDKGKESVAYYSEWKELKTKIRTKKYDETEGVYVWVDENVKNPDVVNFNQIEIPITKGEIVEIKIKSLSEAGWPNNPLESDWSNIVTVTFENNSYDSENTENISRDVVIDNAVIETKRYFKNIGVEEHVKNAVSVDGKVFSHSGEDIYVSHSGIGDTVTLNAAISEMANKISLLENTVTLDKGNLKVTFINDDNIITVNKGDVVSVFAGYYKDIIDNTVMEDGAIVTKSYTISLTNDSKTPLELVARMSGGINDPILETDNFDQDYLDNRMYHKVPLVTTDVVESDNGSYKYPSPYQSAQVKSQFLNIRYKNYGLDERLYSKPDVTVPQPYDFKGVNVDGHYVPYSGYGHYLPFDPTYNVTGSLQQHQDVWNGGYYLNLPVGNGYLSEFAIHKDHTTLIDNPNVAFSDLVRPAITNGLQSYHNFTHGAYFEIDENEGTNSLGGKYFMQVERFNVGVWDNSQNLSDRFYPVKMGFVESDEYLIGKYTCGAYLFVSINNYKDISISGNHPALSTKVINVGDGNAVNIPVLFQFRATDKLGYVGGYRISGTMDNVKYTKRIGIDIYLRGNNPISYGDVFSFDIEVSGQYKAGLNVIDPIYTPGQGELK